MDLKLLDMHIINKSRLFLQRIMINQGILFVSSNTSGCRQKLSGAHSQGFTSSSSSHRLHSLASCISCIMSSDNEVALQVLMSRSLFTFTTAYSSGAPYFVHQSHPDADVCE